MSILSRPLFTDTYDNLYSFTPDKNSTYIFSSGEECRSKPPKNWRTKQHCDFLSITETENSVIFHTQEGEIERSIRGQASLTSTLHDITKEVIYIDITGMGHNTWAPLLKCSLETQKTIICVYSEPKSYRFSNVPTEGTIFDLSTKISGIRPIAGFSNLRDPDSKKVCFIPLLGFEGARLAYTLQQLEPSPPIIPIIGAPGFMLEYPSYSYWGNKNVLHPSEIWRDIKYTPAHCPFSLYYTLLDIKHTYPNHFLRIAPIGTKPHGLGSILYALLNHDNTEIIYDNPIRKGGRTSGQARVHTYHISQSIPALLKLRNG